MTCSITARGIRKVYASSGVAVLAPLSLRTALRSRVHAAAGPRGDKVALEGVDLVLAPGDRLGVVGRNGAGKSTLLGILAGLQDPTAGTLEVSGKVTAVMTLGVGLREDLTGRENIYIDGELQGKSREQTDLVIDQVIEFADIGEFIDFPLRTYSSGMKSRLAFAMLITIDPEILIIDEALSAGDAGFAAKASAKVRELCERGRIVIIVSHGMGSIVDMCNRCIWLEKGRIVMDADPESVTQAYLDAVRKEDERVLLEKFKRHLGAVSEREGCCISGVHVCDAKREDAQAIFHGGEALEIRFRLELAAPLARAPRLTLSVLRLDGLLIAEEPLCTPDFSRLFGTEGCTAHRIALGPMPLGDGVYRVELSLGDAEGPIARAATVFEVQLTAPPRGGRPALIYPANVTLRPSPTIRT